jgi:hypothetical protein
MVCQFAQVFGLFRTFDFNKLDPRHDGKAFLFLRKGL